MAGLSPVLQKLIKEQKNKHSRSQTKFVKPKEGKTRYRILQADPNKEFWQELGVHWIKMGINDKPVAVVGCRKIVYGEPCEIDIAIEKAIRSAVDDDAVNLYKSWKERKSVLVWALVRSGPDASEEPQILELTTGAWSQVLSIIDMFGEDGINALDPADGIDIVIERKGKNLDTEYTVMPAPKSDPVPKGTLEKLGSLLEVVEREYFKGDEPKALKAIASVSGVSVGPGLTSSKAALLTSAVAPGAFDLEAVAPKAAPAPAPAPVEKIDDFGAELDSAELDKLLSGLDAEVVD